MLDKLPTEIIEQILGYLLTASSIVNVGCANRRLHSIVSKDDYVVFKSLVQNGFPSIDTPPLWRELACILTSRSRAWDRRAFIARDCSRPDDPSYSDHTAYQSFGYIPLIDSYEECFSRRNFASRKKVLAFGAGGRLHLRTTKKGHTEWRTYREPNDGVALNEIMHVQLLRPHQNLNFDGESIVMIRENGALERIESGADKDSMRMAKKYLTLNGHFDCMDISMMPNALMAVCNSQTLQLFQVHAELDSAKMVRPGAVLAFSQYTSARHRKRSIKFLDAKTIATGIQAVEGREVSPIMIFDITATGDPTNRSYQPMQTLTFEHAIKGRHCANVLNALDDYSSSAARPGQVFLSGWSDGIVRLHDNRTSKSFVAQYVDYVDDGQILSLATVGHERFFAASHQNACLKCFDMRMPGARVYSYLDASTQTQSQPQPQPQHHPHHPERKEPAASKRQRDMNMFLAVTPKREQAVPNPRGRPNWRSSTRYRGSVYSLSMASPYSTTLFAGIENRVVEIDFVSTDDVLRRCPGLCDPTAGLPDLTVQPESDTVLNLSCYERPRDTHIITDSVLLRKQTEWPRVVEGSGSSKDGRPEEGWDHRWRLSQSRMNKPWRANDGESTATAAGAGAAAAATATATATTTTTTATATTSTTPATPTTSTT